MFRRAEVPSATLADAARQFRRWLRALYEEAPPDEAKAHLVGPRAAQRCAAGLQRAARDGHLGISHR